ncbi:ammonium transporter [Parashewanella tropica]|uniref:ammonium transporter n=1 Tax=Parashewanella tropica TaxID=2547970 RepID=UPI00105A37E2|nr:ammonium transporter [Parashewanella tropica]
MEQYISLSYALNTFYILMSGALVMWMAAGFSMLEAGLIRTKNTTEILTKNVALYSIACIAFLITGYALMYGSDKGGFWVNFGVLLNDENSVGSVIAAADDPISFSNYADFFFQVVFVATALSIVSGAVAERMKLTAFLIFSVVMAGFIYPVQGFWNWGGGFLSEAGFYDFAGSGTVHLAGAAAALAGVLLIGPRLGKYNKNGISPIPGANLPLATLGTMILWMGWLGFNGGSQLAIADIENANAVAKIFVNTNTAAAGGVIGSLLLSKLIFKKIDLTMLLNGALSGLVVITADPYSPSVLLTLILGLFAGAIVFLSIIALDKLKVDDPVGAISVHGIAGVLGLLFVPLANEKASFLSQLYGIVCIFSWVFLTSIVFWLLIKKLVGLRVTKEEELQGLDLIECGMEAYPEFTTR